MSSRSAFGTAAVVLAASVVGAALWGTAAVAVAQYTEDLCFDDLDARAGYGAYHSDWTPWPPSHDCELLGNDVEPVVVRHRVVAVGALAALAGVPIINAIAATLGVILWRRRRRIDQAGPR